MLGIFGVSLCYHISLCFSHSVSSCSDQLEAVSRDRDRLIEQLQQGAILFERQLQAEQHKCKMITILLHYLASS